MNAFLHLLIWSCYFYLSFLMWGITFIDLWILYQPCILRINPTWSRCIMSLIYYWILFANILLRLVVVMFFRNIGLSFNFFVVSVSGFGIRIMLASQNEFGSPPSSWILKNSFRRTGVLLRMFDKIHLWHLVQGFCWLGIFWLLLQFH